MKQALSTKNKSNSTPRFDGSHPSKTIAYDKEAAVKFQNGRYYFASWAVLTQSLGPLPMNPVPNFGARFNHKENMNLARTQNKEKRS